MIDGNLTTASRKRRDNKPLPKFIQSNTNKNHRRKALSTAFGDMLIKTTSGKETIQKKFKHLDSINTIHELSNDEYSKGGYSSQLKATPIKNTSNGESRHSVLEKESISQKTS